ncbi:MAG TPA: hypothetical protein VF095_01790 [Bacillota bacterium]
MSNRKGKRQILTRTTPNITEGHSDAERYINGFCNVIRLHKSGKIRKSFEGLLYVTWERLTAFVITLMYLKRYLAMFIIKNIQNNILTIALYVYIIISNIKRQGIMNI